MSVSSILRPLREAFRSRAGVGLKRKVEEIMCHPTVGRAIGRIFRDRVPSGSFRVHTPSPNVSPRIKAQVLWGVYESAELRSIARHLRDDLDVVELGSSLGVVSCHIGRRLLPGKRLFCVEANPRLENILRENLRSNCPFRDAVVVQQAVFYGSEAATISLTIGDDVTVSRVGEGASEGRRLDVERTTLSRLLQEHGVTDYTLVCDIEGAEAGIIFADRAALSGCRQIIAELHATDYGGHHYTPEELARVLVEEAGFAVARRDGNVWTLER